MITYTIHQDDGTGHCTARRTEWPCATITNTVDVADVE